jgi:hypothetical protein
MIDPIEKPMTSRHPRPARWTVGRVLTILAIIMVAVPLAIYSVKGVTNCGSDFLAMSLFLGLLILVIRPGWRLLKSINDRLDRYLPNHSAEPQPKLPPLDDF